MALLPIKFFRDEPSYDFMGKRWLGFGLSVLLIAASVFMLATKGLNWGIDFTGGVLMEIRTERPAKLSDLRPLFPASEFGEVSLQHFGDEQEVLIRLELAEGTEQAELVAAVKNQLENSGYQIDYRRTDYVGPTVGEELVQAGMLATGLAVLAILLYIWFRFEWQFGVGAVIALLHDAILTLGFLSVTGFEFGLPSIAAILTILGYSINDSVVIFDRVREMRRKYKKMSLPEMLNKSLNLNLARTLLTSGTTLLALVALVTLGGEVIRGFASAILFGVAVGTYSSIYVAVPVLIYFGLMPEEEEEEGMEGEIVG
jgi:preprotein translocase SecF subunit